MSRYFRLHVPKRQINEHTFAGDVDLIFDRDHIKCIEMQGDSAAWVSIDGCDHPSLVYKDEADRLLKWMECEE